MMSDLEELYDKFNTIFNYHPYFKLYKSEMETLDIQCTILEMKKQFKNSNNFSLRKYNNEKTLVIGCGNHPRLFYGKTWKEMERLHPSWYRERHNHKNCCTIDPDIAVNPTVVGLFGVHEFPMFPDNAFKLIIFEGAPVDINLDNYKKELNRLLATNGKVIKIPYDFPSIEHFYLFNNSKQD